MDKMSSTKIATMFPSYTIRNIKISPGLVLAPMSGVTSMAFRRLIKQLNPGAVGLMVSEFISVEGMTREGRKSLQMMRFHPEERPYAIQIFGHDIDRMRDAAMMVQDAGADIVDINCGCPAPKVVRRGGGCELMRQPEHVSKIFSAVRRAVSIPLTMKMRSGWDESCRNVVEIAHIVESEGVEAIAVHGRTRAQLYRGEADWDIVEQVAARVKIPVSGSGDVVDRRSALARHKGSISGLFIGRGAIANPLVFSQIAQPESVQGLGNLRTDQSLALAIIDRYIALLQEELSERASMGRLKQLVSQMCHGHSWRKALLQSQSLAEFGVIISRVRNGDWIVPARGRDESAAVLQEFEDLEHIHPEV